MSGGPAQAFCAAVGAIVACAGALGLVFGGADFATGDGIRGEEFIVFEVNGWHNLVHLLSGLLLLALGSRPRVAAWSALGFGLVYAALAAAGFAGDRELLGLLAVDAADNWLHAVLAATGVGAGIAGGAVARVPRTAA